MGAAHSKRRAGRDTYRRAFAGKLYRAPKGRRWTKPSVIVDALEALAVTKGAIGVAPLLAYARQCRDTLTVKTLKKGQGFPGRFPTGNRGNVFLEYAWVKFTRNGRIMSEQDIMADHNDGKIDRWYDSLSSARVTTKVEVVAKVKDKKRMKRTFKKAAKKAQTEAEKAKALGDKVRAEAKAARERQAKFATEYRAEQDLIQSFKDMLK
jgi:hypothetical protein